MVRAQALDEGGACHAGDHGYLGKREGYDGQDQVAGRSARPARDRQQGEGEAEDDLERLKAQWRSVERSLGDPAIYRDDPKKSIALGKDKSRIEAQIAAAEESWLTLSAEYEDAQRG